MKKPNTITLACIITFIVVISLASASFINRSNNTNNNAPLLKINNIDGVSRSNGDYNISIFFPSRSNITATYSSSEPIDTNGSQIVENFGINNVAQEEIPGLAIYLNGTVQNVSNTLRFYLGYTDSLQVNLLVPCDKYASGSTINVCSWGGTNGEGSWDESVQLP